jgi:hypothetical protein
MLARGAHPIAREVLQQDARRADMAEHERRPIKVPQTATRAQAIVTGNYAGDIGAVIPAATVMGWTSHTSRVLDVFAVVAISDLSYGSVRCMNPPLLSTTRRLKRIAPLQLGKMLALLYGILGLIFIPFFLIMSAAASQMPSEQRVGMMAFGAGFALLVPFIYAAMGL